MRISPAGSDMTCRSVSWMMRIEILRFCEASLNRRGQRDLLQFLDANVAELDVRAMADQITKRLLGAK